MKKIYAVIYKNAKGEIYQARATDGEWTVTIPVSNSKESTVKKHLKTTYPGCEIWISNEVKSE